MKTNYQTLKMQVVYINQNVLLSLSGEQQQTRDYDGYANDFIQ